MSSGNEFDGQLLRFIRNSDDVKGYIALSLYISALRDDVVNGADLKQQLAEQIQNTSDQIISSVYISAANRILQESIKNEASVLLTKELRDSLIFSQMQNLFRENDANLRSDLQDISNNLKFGPTFIVNLSATLAVAVTAVFLVYAPDLIGAIKGLFIARS